MIEGSGQHHRSGRRRCGRLAMCLGVAHAVEHQDLRAVVGQAARRVLDRGHTRLVRRRPGDLDLLLQVGELLVRLLLLLRQRADHPDDGIARDRGQAGRQQRPGQQQRTAVPERREVAGAHDQYGVRTASLEDVDLRLHPGQDARAADHGRGTVPQPRGQGLVARLRGESLQVRRGQAIQGSALPDLDRRQPVDHLGHHVAARRLPDSDDSKNPHATASLSPASTSSRRRARSSLARGSADGTAASNALV